MQTNNFWGLMGAIVTVALATTLVSSPETARIFREIGRAFSGSLTAAMGN